MDPKKLKYILERAAQDDQLEEAERLQRGELSAEEAEALRKSKSPDAEVLYELYRPLDDLEKHRLLGAATRKRSPIGIAAAAMAVAAAAVLAVVSVQWANPTEPVQIIAGADSAKIVDGHHTLGSADGPEPSGSKGQPVIYIGGCISPVVMSPDREGRLPAGKQVMTFFQRGSEVVPWPVEFQYNEPTGDLRTKDTCARVPSAGLSAGPWQLVVVHGSSLPSVRQAESVLRGAFRPPWSHWNIARIEVQVLPAVH